MDDLNIGSRDFLRHAVNILQSSIAILGTSSALAAS